MMVGGKSANFDGVEGSNVDTVVTFGSGSQSPGTPGLHDLLLQSTSPMRRNRMIIGSI